MQLHTSNTQMTGHSEQDIQQMASMLKDGKTMLYPTDTIWGLGCAALHEDAVKKVYEIKKRPETKSMILLMQDWEMLQHYVYYSSHMKDEIKRLLIETSIPTTFIFLQTKNLPSYLTSNNGSVAIRIPQHEFCQQILHHLGAPIISTSANIAGEKSPLHFKDIEPSIVEQTDIIVDQQYDTSTYKQASRILLLSENGEIEALR